jgi:hypothetical protein
MGGLRARWGRPGPRLPRVALLLTAVVLVAAASASVVTVLTGGRRESTTSCRQPMFGILEADAAFMTSDAAAGACFATINLDWAKWESAPGMINTAYRAAMEREAAEYRASGWVLAVDAGLQEAPSWVLELPGGQLIDQYGVRSGTADFEFSAAVRAAAAIYMRDVVKSMGHVAYYRIGLSESGETLYPHVVDNGWWAYGPALGVGTKLPAGVGRSPLPGWVPGSPEWRGQAVDLAEVTAWYDWYFSAMVDAHAWEMATYRRDGFTGELELVIPGTGALPANYGRRLSEDLAPNAGIDFYSTMNTGAVWWKFLDDLPSLRNAVLDISSVYDGSGSPRGNVCNHADSTVADTDPQIVDWSDTRWLTYLATKHHIAVMGENPGNTPAEDLSGISALVRNCHLVALQWAWDYTLHGNDGSATLQQVAGAMATVSSVRPG